MRNQSGVAKSKTFVFCLENGEPEKFSKHLNLPDQGAQKCALFYEKDAAYPAVYTRFILSSKGANDEEWRQFEVCRACTVSEAGRAAPHLIYARLTQRLFVQSYSVSWQSDHDVSSS